MADDIGSLHVHYRPKTWEEVTGQTAAVKSIRGVLKRRESHAYMLSGPSGVGKTTIARLAANELDCAESERKEVNAAKFTGVDDMRGLTDLAQYRPFTGATRCIIIDECHRLSSNAWDSLLKEIEEPPSHAFWFFCTTNISKVPETIKTRCSHIILKELTEKDLGRIYDEICAAEGIELPDAVGDMIIREAHGSGRQLLQNLSMCREAKAKKEAAAILKVAQDTDQVIKLCRFLANGQQGSWRSAMDIVGNLADESPESIRIVAMNYFGKAALGARNDREAAFFLSRLEAFAVPFNQAEGIAPLMLAIGRVMFSMPDEE